MYLEAMADCGADTAQISGFIDNVFSLQNVFVAIRKSDLHPKGERISRFHICNHRRRQTAQDIAAAFTFGREDLIPAMFTEILRNFQQNFPESNLEN
jgi:hypothetical protein